jgi:hypothetical protein
MPLTAEIVGKYSEQFKRTFGVPLQKFCHPLFGFDVIAFDDKIVQPPDGTSTKEAVLERWGQDAVDMILALIDGA